MPQDPDIQVVFNLNDHTIEVLGLKNTVSGAFQNAATVTLTMRDIAGTEVVGVTWPLTVPFVAASSGDYRETIDKALVVNVGSRYVAEVTAAQAGLDAFWRVPIRIEHRES